MELTNEQILLVKPFVDAWIRRRGTNMDGQSYVAALQLAAYVKAALAAGAEAAAGVAVGDVCSSCGGVGLVHDGEITGSGGVEFENGPVQCVKDCPVCASSGQKLTGLQAEIDRLNAIINTPHADEFLKAVSTEAEHQRQRWGSEHDAGKAPADWFWLVGYLAGKALHAHAAGNVAKAEHHIITTAAACANWHRSIFGKTDMRPGINGEAAIAAQQKEIPNETR